jgi:hypothetical protein
MTVDLMRATDFRGAESEALWALNGWVVQSVMNPVEVAGGSRAAGHEPVRHAQAELMIDIRTVRKAGA